MTNERQQQSNAPQHVEGLGVVDRTESGKPIYGMEDGIEEELCNSSLFKEVEQE